MTGIAQMLADLESRGIILFLEAGEMRYRSPRNALSDADRAQLRAQRAEIVAWLRAREAGKTLRTIKGRPGPLTPSVAQEMWWRFAGYPEEGKPVALNIGMAGTFRDTNAKAVTAAIAALMARHEALRVSFRAEGETLSACSRPAEAFVIEQESAPDLATADRSVREFCARLNPILGDWLTRAKVIALPDDRVAVAISSAHMIADAASRNIVMDELRDILEGRALAPVSTSYNDYSLAERDVLTGPQGRDLIAYWRHWYEQQPTLTAPVDGTALLWGTGARIVRNFSIPGRVLDSARALAGQMKVMPFLVYLTIFAIAMARWSRRARFPLRVLGDKRTSMELTGTVGLMFCADAVQIHAEPDADFETVLRGIVAEYDATLARRIPTLHFYAPQMVRPGVEAAGYPNRIPAVFNYYAVGTAREKTERAEPDGIPTGPWPPRIVELPPQTWPRVSSPVFLHLMDYGDEASASLHFYEGVLGKVDQDSFTALLLQVFTETLAA
jgi:pyochelin synthetase